jgi:hypothetical protein
MLSFSQATKKDSNVDDVDDRKTKDVSKEKEEIKSTYIYIYSSSFFFGSSFCSPLLPPALLPSLPPFLPPSLLYTKNPPLSPSPASEST